MASAALGVAFNEPRFRGREGVDLPTCFDSPRGSAPLRPPEAVDAESSGRTAKGFARRYGLAIAPPTVRLRILDPACAVGGLRDLAVPLPDLCALDLDIDTVFFTENKTNGLCFPDVPRAAVIFGLGYGAKSLGAVGWLADKRLYYWGDIDTRGLRILDQVRGLFPAVCSMLMDENTLQAHLPLYGQEDEAKRYTEALHRLDKEERSLYAALLGDRYRQRLRLE